MLRLLTLGLIASTAATDYDYQVIYSRMSFADAEARCADSNGFQGHLASFDDEDELAHLRSMGVDRFWIGGQRAGNIWRFTDGSSLPNPSARGTQYWADKEPNNWRGNENCLVSTANGINDASCTRVKIAAICKRVHIPNPLLADAFIKREGTNCWYKYYNNIVNKQLTWNRRRTWWDAQGFCQADTPLSGGNLVSITDEAEANWLRALLRDHYQEWTWRPIWIGLHGIWSSPTWTDGSQLDWTEWIPGEPNQEVHNHHGEEHCAQMSHSSGKKTEMVDNQIPDSFGKWNDAACDRKRGWICEICTDDW